jgi:hypothetical protein
MDDARDGLEAIAEVALHLITKHTSVGHMPDDEAALVTAAQRLAREAGISDSFANRVLAITPYVIAEYEARHAEALRSRVIGVVTTSARPGGDLGVNLVGPGA